MKNTDNSQLRRLQTLGQAFNKNRIVSPEEMEAILEAIVGALATFKKENQDLNNDTKNIVENYFEIAEKEYNKILDLFENKHYKVSSEINEKINLVKNLIEEFKAIKPKDGQNGKDGVAPTIEEIVPKVLKQIKIPEPEKFELNSEELINKINEAEGENKIDASKIKNLPIPKSIGGRGIVEAPKDSKIYGRKNREWVEVEGAGEHNHDDLYYQKSEVDTKITDLIDSSPATLNTLNELASALGDDPNFATTIATQIGNKEDTVNKTTAIAGNETSNVKFPTVKAIYDWATGLFATITSLNSHTSNTSNPHNVTKSQVGLGNVDNTSDVNKPISTATQTALNLKADDANVVHKTGDESIQDTKTFGTNSEATTKRIQVTGYSDTVPLQEWGDGTGAVGTYIRRTVGNVMQFVARNYGGYANEFLGKWTVKGELDGNIKLNTPQGHMLNGKIVTSVASGNLTVAIKTLAGTDPSSSDPVYVRIGNTVRSITSSFSYSTSGASNYLNMGSSELGNQEVDLFVFLVWNSVANSVHLFASRIPYARTIGDFVISTTDEKGVILSGNPSWNVGDEVENIGRFNIIQNPSTFALSIPATSIIINRPIFETRRLNYNAQWSSSGTQPAIGNGSISSAYQVVMNRINVYVKSNMGSTTTYGTGNYQWSLPFVYYASTNLIQLQAGSGAFYNGSSFQLTPHNNYYFGGSGVSWTSSKDLISGGVCSKDNPVTWASGYYFGFGWQYDI